MHQHTIFVTSLYDMPHYVDELSGFDDATRKRILLDNVTELNTPAPA